MLLLSELLGVLLLLLEVELPLPGPSAVVDLAPELKRGFSVVLEELLLLLLLEVVVLL